MTNIWRQVDQWVSVGDKVFVCPTDIDPAGIFVIARGEMLGGPDDGATFEKTLELGVGSSASFGPLVTISLLAVRGDAARFGVIAPPNLEVKDHEPPAARGGKA